MRHEQLLKEERHQETDARLEIHHVFPKYKGGNGDVDNEQALTLPEHATVHLRLAREADTRDDASANFWSVRAIVKRMSEKELQTFNEAGT